MSLIHFISSHSIELVFQWIPGHFGIYGNEQADRRAGLAILSDPIPIGIDLDFFSESHRYQAPELDRRYTTTTPSYSTNAVESPVQASCPHPPARKLPLLPSRLSLGKNPPLRR
jgi:hypothetical protein